MSISVLSLHPDMVGDPAESYLGHGQIIIVSGPPDYLERLEVGLIPLSVGQTPVSRVIRFAEICQTYLLL